MLIARIGPDSFLYEYGAPSSSPSWHVAAAFLGDKDLQREVSGLGSRIPGGFDESAGFFEMGAESFWLAPIGTASVTSRELAAGWTGARSRGQSCLYGRYRVWASRDAMVFATDPSLVYRIRTVLILRTREIRGWSRRGRSVLLHCLAEDEQLLVSSCKVEVNLRDPEGGVVPHLQRIAPEARDLEPLDAANDLRLPELPDTRTMLLLMVLPGLATLAAFFTLLGLATTHPPGSPGALASLNLGFLALVVGLPVWLVGVVAGALRRLGASARLWDELHRRSAAGFLRRHSEEAALLVRWAASRGMSLDYSPLSLHALGSLDAHLKTRYPWPATVRTFSAYLGAVLLRSGPADDAGEWDLRQGSGRLLFRRLGVSLPVFDYATARLTGREPLSPARFYEICFGQLQYALRRPVRGGLAPIPHH